MIIKDGCDTMINLENKKDNSIEEEKNVLNQSVNIIETNDEKDEDPLLKMINEYGGMDGLSFEIKNSPEKTIKAEETKMNEEHLQYTKKNLSNKKIKKEKKDENEEIINDPSVNHLTYDEIKNEIRKLENEMNEEINKIKELYMRKTEKYKKSLKFLDKYPFLKNMNEYKDYKKFVADKMKQKMNIDNNNNNINHNHVNKLSSSNLGSNSIIKPNQVYYYNYKHNNISLKDKGK